MYKRSEGFFKGSQDTQLFFQLWENPKAQGTILITHGQGEHSESYSRLIDGFANDKWSFAAWDLRGHGRSEGRRGYVANFDDYCTDFKIFLDNMLSSEKVSKGPVVLFCHSMGALISIKTLLRHPEIKLAAVIVSAPLLGLSVPVPFLKAKGALLLNQVVPQITLGNEINNNMLTRDLDVIREFEQDSLRHTRISPGAFIGFMESIDYVIPRAKDFKYRTLFILPENDPVVSTTAAKSYYQVIGSKEKEIFIYPEARHELINDINRQTVYADIKKFLNDLLEKHQ